MVVLKMVATWLCLAALERIYRKKEKIESCDCQTENAVASENGLVAALKGPSFPVLAEWMWLKVAPRASLYV